jgi:hypothetical protein
MLQLPCSAHPYVLHVRMVSPISVASNTRTGGAGRRFEVEFGSRCANGELTLCITPALLRHNSHIRTRMCRSDVEESARRRTVLRLTKRIALRSELLWQVRRCLDNVHDVEITQPGEGTGELA